MFKANSKSLRKLQRILCTYNKGVAVYDLDHVHGNLLRPVLIQYSDAGLIQICLINSNMLNIYVPTQFFVIDFGMDINSGSYLHIKARACCL